MYAISPLGLVLAFGLIAGTSVQGGADRASIHPAACTKQGNVEICIDQTDTTDANTSGSDRSGTDTSGSNQSDIDASKSDHSSVNTPASDQPDIESNESDIEAPTDELSVDMDTVSITIVNLAV